MHPTRPGLKGSSAVSAAVLDALSGGRYLVRDYQTGPPSAHPGTYVYILDTKTKTQKIVTMDAPGELYPFRLSPSGRELAAVVKQQAAEGADAINAAKTIWVFDVESGEQKKLISFLPSQNGPKWIGLVGWLGSR